MTCGMPRHGDRHPGDGRLEALRTQRGAARIVRVEGWGLERGKDQGVRQREILLRGQTPFICVLHIKNSRPAGTAASLHGLAAHVGTNSESPSSSVSAGELGSTESGLLGRATLGAARRSAPRHSTDRSSRRVVGIRIESGAARTTISAGRELTHASTECRSRPPAWLASQNSARRSPRYAPTRLVRAIKFMWSGVFVNPSLRTLNEIPNAASARSASSTKQSVIGSSRAGRVEPATTASFLPRPTPILRRVYWRPRTLRTACPCTSHVIRSVHPARRDAGTRIWRPHSSSAMKSRFVRFFQPGPIIAKPAPFAAKGNGGGWRPTYSSRAGQLEARRRSARTAATTTLRAGLSSSMQPRRGGAAEARRQWRAHEINDFVGFQNLHHSVANGPPPTRKCSCSLIRELLVLEGLCRPGMMPFSDLPANDALPGSKTHPGPTNWTKPKQSDVGSSEAFARKPVDAGGWQKLVGLAKDSDSGDIEKIKDTYRDPSKRDFSKPVLPVGKHVEHVLHVSSGTSTRLATRSTASPGRDSPRTPGGHEHEMATAMKPPVFRPPPSITKPSADVAGGAHELPRTRTAGGIAIASGRESGDVDRAPPGRPIHGDVG
ncbi:hypothetical protein V8D89_005760 [Ganoderma adspersum]